MEWKTIEKDGYPAPGKFCLVEVDRVKSQWSKYHVYFYGYNKPFPNPAFWLYDVIIPDKQIVRYIEIDGQ